MLIQEKISAQIFFRNGTSITLTEKNIISASVRRQCCPDSNFEIGGIYSASLSMTASVSGTNSYNIRGAKIILKNQYGNEAALQPMGIFWITQVSRISGDLYSFTAQDAVGWLDTSLENYSDREKGPLENIQKYVATHFNASPVTLEGGAFGGWCERITSFTNSILLRTVGFEPFGWEKFNTAINGRYTNDWNFIALPAAEGKREIDFICSLNAEACQSNSPRDLLHYLAELAGGFIYAKENGALTLGQFGQAEFGQTEISLSDIEADSCEIAEFLLQLRLVSIRSEGAVDSSSSGANFDYDLLVPFDIIINSSNPFLDGFRETEFSLYTTESAKSAGYTGNGLQPIKDGLFYFHHRKDANGNLLRDNFCYFRPFHCKVHKQERFHLGQRIKIILGEGAENMALSTITSVKWTFRGGWELACAGEDSRSMADALRRSKADKALTDAKLRYESLLSKISGGGV